MTVAIPIFGSRVSPRFDCAPSILMVTVKGTDVTDRETVSIGTCNSLMRINWLCQQNAGVVICGGISSFSLRLLMDRGIQVFPWICADIDDALRLFLSGQLKSGLTIGPGGRGRRCRRGWGRGSGPARGRPGR